MRFGETRTIKVEGYEQKVIDLSLSRKEFRTFAHVVKTEVFINPPKFEGNFSLDDIDRDKLIEALVTAQQGRFRTTVTIEADGLEDLSGSLAGYPERGGIAALQMDVDPTIVPNIAQSALSMAQQITSHITQIDS